MTPKTAESKGGTRASPMTRKGQCVAQSYGGRKFAMMGNRA